ncbi:UNVERIFIED_CONTAM: hypothetical protein FKN15_039333 [Acipenser sinensis]
MVTARRFCCDSFMPKTVKTIWSLLDDDFFSKLAEEAGKDEDIDDMDADLFGSKKPSSAPSRSLSGGLKQQEKPKAALSDDDDGDILGPSPGSKEEEDLLDDQDEGKDSKHWAPQRKDNLAPSEAPGTKQEETAPPASAPTRPAAVLRKREELSFDEDGDELMEALGFGESPKGRRRAEDATPQPARSRLDEILGRGTAPRLLERPLTGESKEVQQEKRSHRNQTDAVVGEEDFTFGAYQPTVASTPEGRQSRRQSVRFSTEDISGLSPEKKLKPATPATPLSARSSKPAADWLGLKEEEAADWRSPSPVRDSLRPPPSPDVPAPQIPSPSNKPPGSSRPPSGSKVTDTPLPASGRTPHSGPRLEASVSTEEDDWLAGALSRKRQQEKGVGSWDLDETDAPVSSSLPWENPQRQATPPPPSGTRREDPPRTDLESRLGVLQKQLRECETEQQAGEQALQTRLTQMECQEQADIKVKAGELKLREEALIREREAQERERQELQLEKERVNGAALRLRQRAEEMDSVSKLASQKYEEGEHALLEAKQVASEHQARLRSIHQQMERLRQQEQHLHQERLRLSDQRRELEQLRQGIPINTLARPLLTSFAPLFASTQLIAPQEPVRSQPAADTGSPELRARLALLKHTAEKVRATWRIHPLPCHYSMALPLSNGTAQVLLCGEFTLSTNTKDRYSVRLTSTELQVQKTGQTRLLLQLLDCIGCWAFKGEDSSDAGAYFSAYFYPFKKRWMSSGAVRQRVVQTFRVEVSQDRLENLKEAEKWAQAIRDSSIQQLPKQEERQNHAHELLREADLSQWDALVILSGDGLLFEVVNGLMERADWEDAVRKPLGILPGGSGNAVAASVNHYSGSQALSSEELLLSCTFLLCKGLVSPLDLASVTTASGQRHFSFLSVAWGFVSDVDIESEKYRRVGAARFTVGTLMRLAALRVYRGRLAYLPAQELPAPGLAEGCPDLPGGASPRCLPSKSHSAPHTLYNSSNSNNSGKAPLPGVQGPADVLLAPLDQSVPAHWTVVKEEHFVLVLAVYQSHLSQDLLAAPKATLGDGLLHLFYVRAGISRAALLHLFLAMEKGTHLELRCPHLSYVPVRAFRLEPCTPKGVITVDGEAVEYGPIQAQVHRGLGRLITG